MLKATPILFLIGLAFMLESITADLCLRRRCIAIYDRSTDRLLIGCRYDIVSCRKRSIDDPNTPETKESWYDNMDVNLDGKIEENEWQLINGHQDDFEALLGAHDTDGDGKISWDELKSVPADFEDKE